MVGRRANRTVELKHWPVGVYTPPMRFVFDEFELDDATFRLTSSGDVVAIEPQVFDVLVYLVNHRERVVSKEELLDNVWGDRFVSESALTSRIKSARRAVGDDGRAQRLIATVHGRGYQFVGEVTEIDPDAPDPISVLHSADGQAGDRSSADDRSGGAATSGPPATTAARRAELLALSVDEEFPFVGRHEVIEAAGRLDELVTAGQTAVLLLGGEPGIGKTRLATEVARRAAGRGMLPLGGRCDPHLATSLQPWLEALAIYVDTTDDELLHADVAGIDLHLRAVAPSLDARLGPIERKPTLSTDEYAVIDALAVLMDRVSRRRPMVIVLDDVHWAGGATRALTSLLLRRGTARLFLLLTFRTTVDDLDQPTRDWLNELSGHASVDRFDLTGLQPADVAEMVESAVGRADDDNDSDPQHQSGATSSDVGSQVFAMSGGHALFATELLRDLRGGVGVDRLPRSVTELVRVRLDGLSPEVKRVVRTAAAIGQEFRLAPVIAATGLANFDALDAVDVALGAELVHEVEGSADRFRFSHQLMPAAVLDAMSSARRVRLHARLAQVMEEQGGSAMAVAHHLIEACPILDAAEVVARVRRTAAAAMAEFDYDSAAGLLARCAELPMDTRHRAEVYVELGAAFNAAGRQPQALEPFDRTTALARTNGWPDLLVEAALGRWGVSPFRASQDRTVIPLIDEALALATSDESGGAVDDVTVARLLAKKAAFNLFSGPLVEREAISAQAMELVGPESTPERLEVVEARWMAIASPAMVPTLAVLDEELEALRKELGALTSDACAPEIGMYWRGQGVELRELAAEIADDPRYRREVDQWRMTALDGTFALWAGDLDEARRLTDRALPLGREPWGEAGRIVHALVHLIIDVTAGEPERSLERWREIAVSVPSDSMRATWSWVEAVAGDRDVADRTISEVAPYFERMSENFMGGMGLVAAAEAVVALDRHDVVEPLRELLLSLNGIVLGHPWAPSRAAPDVLSLLDMMVCDEAAAQAHAEQALAVYDDLGAATLGEALRSRMASKSA